MGEFNSRMFWHLYQAADIPYNPNLPDNAFVYQDVFINADAKKMDRMKTAIMRVILGRAFNYMVEHREDKKCEKDRAARATFEIEFTTSNADHSKDAYASDVISAEGVKASRPAASKYDTHSQPTTVQLDPLVEVWLENFVNDCTVEKILKSGSKEIPVSLTYERLYLNCPPPD